MQTRFAAMVPLLFACTETTTPDLQSVDPEEENLVTEEGSFGRVRVQTPDGPMTISYQVKNGIAVHELDMELGPVENLTTRGGAARLGYRWPNGHVNFAFEPDVRWNVPICKTGLVDCVNAKTRVRETLADMEKKLPLNFTEVDWDADVDRVGFRYENGLDQAGKSTHTGMEGGIQYIKFRAWHADDGFPPAIQYHLGPSAGTVRHEMLHAVGVWHEQSRNDREEFISPRWECIEDSFPGCIGDCNGNYEIKDESADLGPYDFASIMHYSQNAACQKDDNDQCVCSGTMTIHVPGAEIGMSSTTSRRRGGFSVEDSNTLHRMYARKKGSNDADDRFGRATAAGDFDADGYMDLAVASQYDDLVSATNAGMVIVYKGTPGGLVAWRQLTQQSFTGQTITANAKFGAGLAALDFDGDGVKDLAVGAPGAAGGAGAVYVFSGSLGNELFTPQRMLTQANTAVDDDVSGDRFGEVLAGGNITEKTRVDCFDKTRTMESLVVGAPGDRILTTFGGTSQRGSVFIFHQNRANAANPNDASCVEPAATLNKPTKLEHGFFTHAGGAAGDNFGAGIAVGDIDGDGKADIAIGAPDFGGGIGRVYIYQGRLPPENPFAWSAMATETQEILATTSATKFGRELAIGTVRTSGRQLAIGAPGGTGRVLLFNASGSMTLSLQQTIVDDVAETGDEFGGAVAMGNVDGSTTADDLIIGAPGEDSSAGRVTILRSGSTLTTRTILEQTGFLRDREANDRFGESFATGDFGGRDDRPSTAHEGILRIDLAIGAAGEKPDSLFGEDVDAGTVDIYRGMFGAPVSYWQTRHQESSGAE